MSRFALFPLVLLACFNTGAQPSTPVILISVDTLRADHLGCYQAGRRTTPNIDALAKTGTFFSQVSSLVPLTLPSHVALFTSTYPFANGVRDNGVPLAPSVITLATVLKDSGYRAAAFVGGFVLDRRFGLTRGFDVYDSPFDLHKKTTTDVGDLKRPGAQVIAPATQWVERNSNTPFFLFLHLYDLHTPYDLPQSNHLRSGEAGYEAELAYVDRVLGKFLTYLEANDIFKRSLVVFTSDHGEGLGDHGESTHGYFIYQTTLRVPLIIHWPAGKRRISQDRFDEPASVLDIAPTILDAIGLPQPRQMRGRSLLKPRDAEELYSESLYARNHFGCAALRSIRVGDYKYIDAPQPELYNLSTDPGERQNLYEQQKVKASALRERLVALRSSSGRSSAGPQSPAPDTINALRSLGYLGGSSSVSRLESRIDPKDRIADFEQFGLATALAPAGKIAESNAVLEKLSGKLPDIVDIHLSLGMNHQRLEQLAEAANEFRFVLELDPLNAQAHFDLGISYFRLQQRESAVKELKAALAIEPWYTQAEELLVEIYLQAHSYEQARTNLEHILSIDPSNYTAHYDFAVLAAMQENWTAAQQEVFCALRTDSGSAEAHNLLGSIYLRRGQLDLAQTELDQAIHLQPSFVSAYYNLALVLENKGQKDNAAEELRTALKIDPRFAAARKELDALESPRP